MARDAAGDKKHPAFGGAARRAGCVTPLARWPHIALRGASTRRDDPRHQMGDYLCKLVLVDLQLYYVLKGWVKFIYEGQDGEMTFRAGDCVLAPAAIRHNEIACSDDFEALEILSPAIHDTKAVDTVPGHEGHAAAAE